MIRSLSEFRVYRVQSWFLRFRIEDKDEEVREGGQLPCRLLYRVAEGLDVVPQQRHQYLFAPRRFDFGFAVSDRFVSVTPVQTDIEAMPSAFLFPQVSPNAWGVEIRALNDVPDTRLDTDFMIIVF